MIDQESYEWLLKTVDALRDALPEGEFKAGVVTVRGLVTTAEVTSSVPDEEVQATYGIQAGRR